MTAYKNSVIPIERLQRQDSGPRPLAFTAEEWRRLAGLYSVITLLHLVGWGLFLYYSSLYPALVGPIAA